MYGVYAYEDDEPDLETACTKRQELKALWEKRPFRDFEEDPKDEDEIGDWHHCYLRMRWVTPASSTAFPLSFKCECLFVSPNAARLHLT